MAKQLSGVPDEPAADRASRFVLEWDERTVQVPTKQKYARIEIPEREVLEAVRELVRNRYGLSYATVSINVDTGSPEALDDFKVEVVWK